MENESVFTRQELALVAGRIRQAVDIVGTRGSIPLRVLAQSVLADRDTSIGPLLSAGVQDTIAQVTARSDFDTNAAEKLHDAVLADLSSDPPPRGTTRAISCPLMSPPALTAESAYDRGSATLQFAMLMDQRCVHGHRGAPYTETPGERFKATLLAGNDVEQVKKGCDEQAGRGYYAKTNGKDVWYAEAMFSEQAKQPVDGFGAVQLTVSSPIAFVLLHELGHIMHIDPVTHPLFRRLEEAYWELGRLVPRNVRLAGLIQVSHDDMLEFVASAFAADNIPRTIKD